MLVFIPGRPWINATLTSLTFLYLAQHLSDAMNQLCGLLLPRQAKTPAILWRMGGLAVLLLAMAVLSEIEVF